MKLDKAVSLFLSKHKVSVVSVTEFLDVVEKP